MSEKYLFKRGDSVVWKKNRLESYTVDGTKETPKGVRYKITTWEGREYWVAGSELEKPKRT